MEARLPPLSRQFGEGGYTFLKRALAEHFNSGAEVTINVGRALLSYSYSDGDNTFEDGLVVIEDNGDTPSIDSLSKVAKAYDVNTGLKELGIKP